jgi:FkbM family methyltransferase
MAEQRFGGLVGVAHRAGAAVINAFSSPETAWRVRFAPWVSRALAVVTAGRGVETDINGERFRIDPRHRVFLQPDYEAAIARYLRDRVKPGQCALDVGAHIGAYALQLARWMSPGGRVIAFEPTRETASVLRRHLRMNGLADTVLVEECAVGARDGTVNFLASPASGLSRVASRDGEQRHPDGDRVSVRPVTIVAVDRYCATHGVEPDWLIIDVEGFEFDVLQGAQHTLRRRPLAPSVVVEMHPELWADAGWTRERGERLIASLGRRVVSLTGQRDPFGEYGPVALEYESAEANGLTADR